MNVRPPFSAIGSSNGVDHGIASYRRSAFSQLAFFERAAGARAGFAAFLGSGFAVSFALPLPPPLIGNSISRWPSTRFFGFLPLALTVALAAGAACFSLARLRLSASIRLITLPVDFGAAFGAGRPLRF